MLVEAGLLNTGVLLAASGSLEAAHVGPEYLAVRPFMSFDDRPHLTRRR